MAPTLLDVLENCGRPRVLVVGDLLLDRYTWGDAQRISPEAPVLVLRAQRQESRPGGAGGVCAMLRGLEVSVAAVGIVGSEPDGGELRELLQSAGVETEGVLADPAHATSIKQRFIGLASSRHPHQILRVDYESVRTPGPQIIHQLSRAAAAELDRCQAVLISDYGKGVCSSGWLPSLIAAARARRIPVLVDPALSAEEGCYRGATLATPNRAEAQHASGLPISQAEQALAAGVRLCERWELDAAVITLDREGMALVRSDGQGQLFPTQARDVYDITGAGDMVLAMLGLAVAGGCSLEDAVRLANVAAGLKVEKFGAVPVSRREVAASLRHTIPVEKLVSLEAMVGRAEELRGQGRRIVFTNGCFDLLHVGHVRYLQEAAGLGDALIVAINSDRSVRQLKGPGRPVIRDAERAAMLAALECVDHVLIFDADTPCELLRQIRPDVLVKGGTYSPGEVVGREIVEAYGGRVYVASHVAGVSTTAIVASLRGDGPSR
jgi:D-beta-D-heptose 7-phosphate kinase/D-beta-D-heptose 1-phosphate adenosyltransferase